MKLFLQLRQVGVGSAGRADQALLVFPAGPKWFALPLNSVEAVLDANSLHPFGGEVASLAGYVDLNGGHVPVLNVNGMLGQDSSPAHPSQVILLRAGQFWAGLAAAGTAEMVSIAAGQVRRQSGSSEASGCALGVCQADGRTITVLDPDKLLDCLGPH